MILDRVTITGADESVDPEQLVALSHAYPHVEWGILASASQEGKPRFPGRGWLERLRQVKVLHPKMRLSLHLCGQWARGLMIGAVTFDPEMLYGFDRLQLNFFAGRNNFRPSEMHQQLFGIQRLPGVSPKQFIFQCDDLGVGGGYLAAIRGENTGDNVIDAVPLFDSSGGAGQLPHKWPAPQFMDSDEDYVYHGYAGGLGPENLATELPRIEKVAKDGRHMATTRIWIDMESRVRSGHDGKTFDLAKVELALHIVDPFISCLASCR